MNTPREAERVVKTNNCKWLCQPESCAVFAETTGAKQKRLTILILRNNIRIFECFERKASLMHGITKNIKRQISGIEGSVASFKQENN